MCILSLHLKRFSSKIILVRLTTACICPLLQNTPCKMTIFKWEIGCIHYLSGSFRIVSPPFYIEPSRTFEFCLHLYRLGRDSLEDVILVLWRSDSNKSSIELTYNLQFDVLVFSSVASYGTYTYNFKTPMQFPESRVHLTKRISERETLLKMTCVINSHIIEDIDKEVMEDLSSSYESLRNEHTFHDLHFRFANQNFYFHKAVLAARCDELAERLNTLDNVDPKFLKRIAQFLYSGKLTPWTTRIIPNLMEFGSSLHKSMCPYLISEYSAKTLLEGNSHIFDWTIENFMNVRSETTFTYVMNEGGNIIQLSFFPLRENNLPNFHIEMFECPGLFIKCIVKIQTTSDIFTLVEMSNTENDPSLLEVKTSHSIDRVMRVYSNCITNGAMKLKVFVHLCSFDTKYTSNVDAISYTNIYKDDIFMYNLREDFKKLYYHYQYYDFVIIVKYKGFHADYEGHHANYEWFHAEYSTLDEDYVKKHEYFRKFKPYSVRFPVHKAILSARSGTFSLMFSHGFNEIRTNQVEIIDVEPFVVHAMLLFMYCGKLINLNKGFAIDLLFAADKYDIKMLIKKCTVFLESIVSADNAEEIQSVARLLRAERLRSLCAQFLERK